MFNIIVRVFTDTRCSFETIDILDLFTPITLPSGASIGCTISIKINEGLVYVYSHVLHLFIMRDYEKICLP